MRLLADESCDHAVVRALRAAGHEVIAIAEIQPGATDDAVIVRALAQGCLVITEDKDFGQLVFASGRATLGVIFLRFPSPARGSMAEAVRELIDSRAETLVGSFVTVRPG